MFILSRLSEVCTSLNLCFSLSLLYQNVEGFIINMAKLQTSPWLLRKTSQSKWQ